MHVNAVDKDVRNQMQAKAVKLKGRLKEEPTATGITILGQNRLSLVSATTYEISLLQENLYLVP